MKVHIFYVLLFVLIYNFETAKSIDNQKQRNDMPFTTSFKSPQAVKNPVALEKHNTKRIDNYYWMNQRDSKEVLDYLNSENEYFENVTFPQKALKDKLFEELKNRIKQTDMSVPVFDNGYFYYTKYEEGKDYPIICRKQNSLENKEEILIDENLLAEGQKYFALADYDVSPNNEIVAYGTDIISRRQYTLYFKNIKTGELLSEQIPNTSGSAIWANDSKTLFYTLKDETLREYKVMKHILGTDPKTDAVVFEENDATFYVGIGKSKSKKFIIIHSGSTVSDESRVINADNPNEQPKIFQPRERNLEYSIDHAENKFYIRTNFNAQNFQLMTCDENSTSKASWNTLIGNRETIFFQAFDLFKNHLVLNERVDGQSVLRVINHQNKKDEYIPFAEKVFSAEISTNPEYNTNILRFTYSSLTTPTSVFDFNMDNGNQTLLKQQEVLGSFNKNNYVSEKLYAKAADGTLIPISLVRRKDTPVNGSAPLLLYGYGSYGICIDPYFSSDRLSLLDRGFIFAIAHIRGGEDLGRQWYENGKLLKKKNTFTDFIDCAHFLVNQKYTNNDKLFAMGGSAGGLLMGAVSNLEGSFFKGILAIVPFVDVVTTMLDESIPLTTGEYDEWGNPNNKEYFDYMSSYSPYDNVQASTYPNMLVMTGYHDSQVQYFEPAKWVAKLRELKTDNNLLLFRCNMDAGHGGASGRFTRLKETAIQYAFMFSLIGLED